MPRTVAKTHSHVSQSFVMFLTYFPVSQLHPSWMTTDATLSGNWYRRDLNCSCFSVLRSFGLYGSGQHQQDTSDVVIIIIIIIIIIIKNKPQPSIPTIHPKAPRKLGTVMTPWGAAFFKNSSKSHLESSEIADRRLHFFNTSWSSFQTSPTLRCSGLEDVPDCLGQPTNDPSNHWEWWHDQRLQRVIGWLPNLVPFFSAWENHGVLRYQLKVEHQTLTSWWFPMLSKVSFLNGKTQGSEKRVSEALWKSRCLLTFPPKKKNDDSNHQLTYFGMFISPTVGPKL